MKHFIVRGKVSEPHVVFFEFEVEAMNEEDAKNKTIWLLQENDPDERPEVVIYEEDLKFFEFKKLLSSNGVVLGQPNPELDKKIAEAMKDDEVK